MYRATFLLLLCALVLSASADLVTDDESKGFADAMCVVVVCAAIHAYTITLNRHGGSDLTASTPHPEETPLPTLMQPNETVPLLDMLVRLQVDTQSESEMHSTFTKLGDYTKTQFGLSCNAFGGEAACVSITRGNSDLARFCNVDEAQIDCMFYNEDMLDLQQVCTHV